MSFGNTILIYFIYVGLDTFQNYLTPTVIYDVHTDTMTKVIQVLLSC